MGNQQNIFCYTKILELNITCQINTLFHVFFHLNSGKFSFQCVKLTNMRNAGCNQPSKRSKYHTGTMWLILFKDVECLSYRNTLWNVCDTLRSMSYCDRILYKVIWLIAWQFWYINWIFGIMFTAKLVVLWYHYLLNLGLTLHWLFFGHITTVKPRQKRECLYKCS